MNRFCTIKTIDGFSLSAVHTISEKKSVVLWLHGITETKDEYLGFFKDGANFLATKGIDSFRFDFRGHGNSSGTSLDFSIVGQLLDVESAISYLISRYINKGPKIYVVGCSFGAPPAIYISRLYPEIIKCIILVAPVLSYKKTFLEPETEWAKSIINNKTLKDMLRTKTLFINESFPISIRLIGEMIIIQPELAISEIKQDIIIIHGDADSMVPYDVSKSIAKLFPSIKLITFKGMDHGFIDATDEEGTSDKSLENKLKIYNIIANQCI